MLAQFLLIQHTILCTHQHSHKSTWPFYSPSLGVMKAKRRKLSLLSHCHRAFIFLLSTILQGKPLVFDRHRAPPGEATIKAGPPQVLCLSQPALTTIHAHKMKTLVPSAQRPVRTGFMRQFQFFVMSTAGDRTATFTGCGVRAKKKHWWSRASAEAAWAPPQQASGIGRLAQGQPVALQNLHTAKTSSRSQADSAEPVWHICAPVCTASHSGHGNQVSASPVSWWPTDWNQKSQGDLAAKKAYWKRQQLVVAEHSLLVFLCELSQSDRAAQVFGSKTKQSYFSWEL